MAETRTVNLEIKDNVKSLKTQYKEAIQEVQRLADAYGATSTEAANAAKNAAQLKDRIEESKSLTDAFNPDAKFNALSGAIGGVVNGFQAYEGAMALIGVENEDLQKTLLKVQSAMALSQGIQGALEAKDAFKNLGSVLKNTAIGQGLLTAATAAYNFVTTASTKGLKLFRIALISTGIGALVVGVGLLVANFDKLLNVFTPVIDGLKNIGDAIGLTDFAGEEAAKNEKARQEKLTKLQEEKNAEILREIEAKEKLDKANKDYQQAEIAFLESQGKSAQSLKKKAAEQALLEAKIAKANELYWQKATAFFEKEEVSKSKLIAADAEILKAQAELNKVNQEGSEKAKQAAEKAKQAAQEARNLRRQIQDEQIKGIEDLNQREQTQLIVTAQRRIEDLSLTAKDKKKNAKLILEIQNNLNKDLEKSDEAFYAAQRKAQEDAQKLANSNKIRLQRELDNIIEQIDEDNFQAGLQKSMTEDEYALELVRQKYFNLEELAKGNAEQLASIETAKALEIEAIDKKSKEKQVAAENELRQKRLQLAGQAFTAIGDIIGSFTAKNDKDARKQFEIQKAFNLAAAVTNTAMAVTGALTAGGNPIKLATGMQFVEAGIAGAVGAANIIKIASSKFGSGAGGGGGGGGDVPSVGASTTPQFNTIGSSGVNQLAQLQQQPVQAYVVSGDVTSAQSLDRNRIQNATL